MTEVGKKKAPLGKKICSACNETCANTWKFCDRCGNSLVPAKQPLEPKKKPKKKKPRSNAWFWGDKYKSSGSSKPEKKKQVDQSSSKEAVGILWGGSINREPSFDNHDVILSMLQTELVSDCRTLAGIQELQAIEPSNASYKAKEVELQRHINATKDQIAKLL